LLALHLRLRKDSAVTSTHNRTISHLFRQRRLQQHHYHVLKLRVNRVSTICGLASWKMIGLCSDINQQSNDRPPFSATTIATSWLLHSWTKCQRSIDRTATMLLRSVTNLRSCNFHNPLFSKMYFSRWKYPGVSERMWSVNLEASVSREYQTLEGYSGRLTE
jgi:hypothetical protein